MPKLSPSAIEKNKSRIEKAAKKLFIKQGFHATSMRNIAARSGTSLGNVYNYYRTKEDILGSIINKYQTIIDGRLRWIFDEIDEPPPPPHHSTCATRCSSARSHAWLQQLVSGAATDQRRQAPLPDLFHSYFLEFFPERRQ